MAMSSFFVKTQDNVVRCERDDPAMIVSKPGVSSEVVALLRVRCYPKKMGSRT